MRSSGHPFVDVIVPVYNGGEVVRRCLESLLANAQKTAYELVVIDDASQDVDLVRYLDDLADSKRAVLLRNPANRGFVHSVNRGMVLHADRDVVLLNSDTEVANDWLDRLVDCAYRASNIGTVTPFSNSATICSFPVFCADNSLPAGKTLAQLDRVFSSTNMGRYADIPTAVGFCMYIRRTCLDQVGLFDEQRFGRGYGEENDFSRRAVRCGWRNVLAADTYVFHAGNVSFKEEREELLARSAPILHDLHPNYSDLVRRFLRLDPLEPYRREVEIELARTGQGHLPAQPEIDEADGKPVQMHVVHDLGGGVARWYRDYCRGDDTRENLILKPYCHGPDFGAGLMLFTDPEDDRPARLWVFATPIPTVATHHAEYRRVIEEILREYRIGSVLVSSLIGHALDVLDTGLPTIFIQHDYFPVCPAINLFFNKTCEYCDNARLTDCQAGNPDFNPFLRFDAPDRIAVREHFLALMNGSQMTVVFPSHTVRTRLTRLWPQFERVPSAVIPHGYPGGLSPITDRPTVAGEKLRVMVLGMLSVSKGVRLLAPALEQLTEYADIYLVGAQEVGELFKGRPGINLVSHYDPDQLQSLVEGIQPDLGLLLSIWPETYSYTLTELTRLGIPAMATRVGAFAERIIHRETGYLFDPCPDALVKCIRDVSVDRVGLTRVRTNLRELPYRSVEEMVADYHRLLPCALMRAYHRTARWNGAAGEHALSQSVDLVRMWKKQKSLYLTLDMKEARLQLLEEQVGTLHKVITDRESRICELRQTLSERENQLATVFGSTSWRMSRPVRWVGTALRKVRSLCSYLKPVWREPATVPAGIALLLRAWWKGGGIGLKQALIAFRDQPRFLTKAPTFTGFDAASGPAKPSPLPQHPIDAIYRHYRSSFDDHCRDMVRDRIAAMPRHPLISILVPVYNTPEPMLLGMIESVQRQLYPQWELCLADDGSSLPGMKQILERHATGDPRIKVHFCPGNRGVSHASNQALALAKGEFTVLLDHDDVLEEEALFRVAESLLVDAPDLLYSDEAQMSEDGSTIIDFIFRPAFSPEYLRSHPYIVHLVGFKTSLLKMIGGFDERLRISQDYDLILRASEQAAIVVHIPEVLYRWRIHANSAGHARMNEVMETSRAVLRRHLARCGEDGEVQAGIAFNYFETRYPPPTGAKVAIIIPTKNHGEVLRRCIDSLQRTVINTSHDIVVVDHESDESATKAYLDSIRPGVTVLWHAGPFNFSTINNRAVACLPPGYTHYLFCNNDVEAQQPGWLERMLELGQKPDVGIVGARLWYPDKRTLQHVGVHVGICGVAENYGRHFLMPDDRPEPGFYGRLAVNHEMSAVTAACLLIRKNVFDAVGGFDESLKVGYGDVDLCLRVGQRGYRVVVCPHADLLHHESYTRGRSDTDPHPEDSAFFRTRWQENLLCGDPYTNPGFSVHSSIWDFNAARTFHLDVTRRVYRKDRKDGHQYLAYSPVQVSCPMAAMD